MALENEPWKNEWTPEMAKDIDRYWSESSMEMCIHIVEGLGVLQYAVPDEQILEVGCGTGKIWEILKRGKIGRYTGVDSSKAMLDVFRSKAPHVNLIQGDAVALPFPDYQFDLVCCIEVLRHMTRWEDAIKELFRVARRRVVFTMEVTEGPSEFKGENRQKGYMTAQKEFVHYQAVHNLDMVMDWLGANFNCKIEIRPLDNMKWMFAMYKDTYEQQWALKPIEGMQRALTMHANLLAETGRLYKEKTGKTLRLNINTKLLTIVPLVLDFIGTTREE
jgi:ubiquinone/menaquinone biosynthesis C-methylase UbiE